ncbi:MAG: aminotransferase class V-fold PLP-dependent enzyme, partial [Vicinamibacterales bacterium]
QGYTTEFDLVGTRDPSAHLAAPAAFAFIESLGGLPAVHAYMHELAWNGASLLAERWGTPLDTPRDLLGPMVTVMAPASAGSTTADASALRDRLLFDEHIEVKVHAWRGRVHLRVSAQVYNELADFEQLADAVARPS